MVLSLGSSQVSVAVSVVVVALRFEGVAGGDWGSACCCGGGGVTDLRFEGVAGGDELACIAGASWTVMTTVSVADSWPSEAVSVKV